MNIRIFALALTCIASVAFTHTVEARPFTRNCPAHADPNFRAVVTYLDDNMDAVRAIYEVGNDYHARRGANRRVERRLGRDRKLGNLWFDCDADSTPLCRNANARHAMGAASNKIRICYGKVRSRTVTPDGSAPDGRGFCSLMSIVAHEFGHAVGMKRDRVGRHSAGTDRLYRWEDVWSNYCTTNGHDRELE